MSQRHWKIIACLFLVLATVAVYGQLRNHQFINFDDNVYVTDNAAVQSGLTLRGIVWAFTTLHAGLWIPLTWLSYMGDSQLFGLHPGAFHLTNLFLHLANTLLLFLWFHRTTGALGRSFLVAALFALHPLHVESVAWVTERKDVLSTFFWLLTMWAYLWYAANRGMKRYLLVLAGFSLGLMAKPMVVTLPLVLLMLDYWPLGRWPGRGPTVAGPGAYPGVSIKHLLWEKAPLLALAALVSVVTIFAQRTAGAVMPLANIPLKMRLANALVAYVSYMGKMVWPLHLAVYYPYPKHIWLWWQVAAPALGLLGISVLALRGAWKYPYLPVGWFWYLGTLVPVIGLVQVGTQGMADRYTYVPLIGLFIIVAWGMVDITSRWRAARTFLPVGAGLVLGALVLCTWLQVRHWQDSISLFEHSLRVTENNRLAQNNLGAALFSQGQVDQAMAHYREALRLQPDCAGAHNNLGVALAKQGQVDQAMAHYREALRLQPDYAEAHNNLGLALAKQGQVDQAMAHYREALRLKPDYAEAQDNLGAALFSRGQVAEAMAHYREALRLKPDYAGAHNNLGAALFSQGQVDQAVAHYREALRLQPDDAEAHNNLGLALAKQGQVDQAMAHYREALRLQPGFAKAYYNLGVVYGTEGKFREAIVVYRKAIQADRDFVEAYNNLGIAYANRGESQEAITMFQKVIQLNPNFSGAYNNLGLVLAKQGKVDQAIAVFEKAIQINPHNSNAQKMLRALKESSPRD
jgi:tetratricopeptide (TPR) repeat protein